MLNLFHISRNNVVSSKRKNAINYAWTCCLKCSTHEYLNAPHMNTCRHIPTSSKSELQSTAGHDHNNYSGAPSKQVESLRQLWCTPYFLAETSSAETMFSKHLAPGTCTMTPMTETKVVVASCEQCWQRFDSIFKLGR
jgi:hypothetical protein